MSFNIEYSCHTITNIKHGWRLSLQLLYISEPGNQSNCQCLRSAVLHRLCGDVCREPQFLILEVREQ